MGQTVDGFINEIVREVFCKPIDLGLYKNKARLACFFCEHYSEENYNCREDTVICTIKDCQAK